MPQRNFKRKSNGKFSRNLESSVKGTRTDDKATGSKSDDTALSLSARGGYMKGDSIVPDRVFVGGISSKTTEWDIRTRFATYGKIKAVNILRDVNGISRGYGFVTFETEEQAKAIVEKGEITFKGRKLNVAPAIRKQSYRSALLSSTEGYNIEKYAGSYIYEQSMRNKGYEEQMYKINYNLTLEYSGNEIGEVQLPMENPRTYMDNGMCFSAPNLQSPDYGSAQMNFMPCPSWVYIPQQNYPGTSYPMAYPVNGNFLEMVQVVPAPLCLLNGDLK